jgi:hypothetical protein
MLALIAAAPVYADATYDVGSAAALSGDIQAIASSIHGNSVQTFTLNITNSFTMSQEVSIFQLEADSSVIINGNGFTISGDGTHRGLMEIGVSSSSLTINNLTFSGLNAVGGAGGSGYTGGGGGAGLGGAVFM